MGRNNSSNDVNPRKKFFERHPALKWTLIGLGIGLLAAAVTLFLVVTLGTGIAPFIAIGAGLGIASATSAGAAGLGIVAGAITAFFGTLFGGISALVNRKKAATTETPRREPARDYSSLRTVEAAPAQTSGQSKTFGRRFFDRTPSETPAETERKSAGIRP